MIHNSHHLFYIAPQTKFISINESQPLTVSGPGADINPPNVGGHDSGTDPSNPSASTSSAPSYHVWEE